MVGLRSSSKALPKAKLAPIKGHGHCLVVCCQFDPLQLPETFASEKYAQQTDEMHGKLQCLQPHWSTERAQFSMTMLEPHVLHNQCFKSWRSWAIKFRLICHIHLTFCHFLRATTTSRISTTFCRENASTTSRRQKILSKNSSNPKHGFLHYRNKLTYFSLTKMCWL